jgi:predicted Fe-Mo cluster-binding NifX family protein
MKGEAASQQIVPESPMKLAVMLYGRRVSPRFGYSQRALIVEIDDRGEVHRKTLGVKSYHPERIPEVLRDEGVALVIAGGINRQFQDLFRKHGIAVIWGIIGDAEDVLATYRAGQLVVGMGGCPHPRRAARCRQRHMRRR